MSISISLSFLGMISRMLRDVIFVWHLWQTHINIGYSFSKSQGQWSQNDNNGLFPFFSIEASPYSIDTHKLLNWK